MLTRESIIGAVPTFPREEVQVPEWGGSVFVRVLTSAERDALEVEWEQTKRRNFRARLVVAATCDEQGKPLFQPQDLNHVGNQPASAVHAICDVAFRLNKFTKEDQKELEKNSESSPA